MTDARNPENHNGLSLQIYVLIGGLLLNLAGICGAILYASHSISTTLEGRLTKVETQVSGLQATMEQVTDYMLVRHESPHRRE